MSDPLDWIEAEAAARSERGLTRTLHPHGPAAPGRFTREDRTVVNFGSNDYLGLAADRRLATAAGAAAERYGWGAGASPLVAGWTECHQALVETLARFEQTEAAALFASGYAANLGTIPALVGPGDVIYSDRLNHASMIDGARLSRATVRIYPHNEVSQLAALAASERGDFRRALIVTEGLFSMDGDLASLADLAALADRFDAILMVDEAHATGVLGPGGRGAAAACGADARVNVRVGTLSKAFGSLGGFVAGSKRLVEHLVNHARPLIYSTALPPPAAAAAQAAIEIAQSENVRRERVLARGSQLLRGLVAAGFEIGPTAGPIVPVVVGAPGAAVALAAKLLSRGFLVPAIRPPSVPDDTARLRISLTAVHSESEVERLIEVLAT
jgi:8-amino-7-oxononanoate synthase